MVQCPKEMEVELNPATLPGGLAAYSCPDCGGTWIPPEHYLDWQCQLNIPRNDAPQVEVLPSHIPLDYNVSPFDNRAGLCPDCKHYLVRGRVQLQWGLFYVERCPNCKGYWCDLGEWEVLQRLKLDRHLEYIFSDLWQAEIKAMELAVRERQATIDKLGEDIAAKIFELAELLEGHPNGDFGVAYLMRRFEK
jgi:Zn-finger nucleic acid-binding protein